MILLEPNHKSKHGWWLYLDKDDKKTQPLKIELNLVASSSIVKKFGIVENVLLEMSQYISGFKEFYYDLIKEYVDSDYNTEVILNNLDQMILFAEKYLEYKNIDYSQFVDTTKSTKTSIMFLEDDMKNLLIASTVLKLYGVISNDEKMKLPENIHRIAYDRIIKNCQQTGVTDKIFQLIRSRIYRSSITDRYMWDLIKASISDTPETYVMVVFNFTMTNLLSMLSVETNPVYFLISIADYKVRWLMRGVYNEKIIYGEVFSGTDDIFGASQSKESLHLYCCNDTIAKCAKLGLNILETEYQKDKSEESFNKIRERLDSIKNLSPAMKFFVLPIASKVLDIPYKYLIATPPKHLSLIGVFLYHVSKDIIDEKYPILNEFLIAYSLDDRYLISKSFYKLKNYNTLFDTNPNIFGFDSKSFRYTVISPLVGILSAIKKNLVSILDGKRLNKITYNNLEEDCLKFYTDLYSSEADAMFLRIQEKVDKYF